MYVEKVVSILEAFQMDMYIFILKRMYFIYNPEIKGKMAREAFVKNVNCLLLFH